MILSNKVKIRTNSRNYKSLTEKGYIFKVNDIIDINISDLSLGSKTRVKVKCDICEKEKEIGYRNYLDNILSGCILS